MRRKTNTNMTKYNLSKWAKSVLLAIIIFASSAICKAQNADVESALKQKYPLVQYHKECGGWYFLSYNTGGSPKYGFADANGNVIVSEASQYKLYPGYISCRLLDLAQKSLHDQWKVDCKIYQEQYLEYQKVEAKYKADVEAFNAKVEAAKAEAERRWQRARQIAIDKAKAEAERLQSQTSGGGILGAVLGGLAGGVSIAAAANSVKYEPFLNQVLGERDLLVEPAKPYNPCPKKPVEPADGYYWKSFSLRQPCAYEYIDFAQIEERGKFADVKREGKWGLVDAEMNEILPCVNYKKVLGSTYSDGLVLVLHQGLYGVLDKNARFVIPAAYKSLSRSGSRFTAETSSGFGLLSDKGVEIIPCRYKVVKNSHNYWLCKDGEYWGVFSSDYDELYPCQFQDVKLEEVSGRLVIHNKNKGLWGVLDFNTGRELLCNNYSSITNVNLGLSGSFYKVGRANSYGLYTDNGVMVIPCEYSNIKSVDIKVYQGTKPMIEVERDGTKGLYEPNGVVVIPAGRYDSYTKYARYYKVSRNSLYGICDLYGNELVPCEYSSLTFSSKLSGFIASKGNKRGVVTMMGRELFPFVDAKKLKIFAKDTTCLLVSNGTEKGYGAIDYSGRLVVPMKNKSDKTDKIAKKIGSLKKKDATIATSHSEKMGILRADNKDRIILQYRSSYERSKFSFFAKNYVERNINEWQKKGEFEKIDDWRKRVNKNTLNQRVFALTKEAQDIYVNDYNRIKPSDNPYIVGDYDPDHETYRIHTEYSKNDILVHVPSKDALEFKSSFAELNKEPKFFIDNDAISLAEYSFVLPNGLKYKYSNEASLTYSIANVKYDLDAIEIDKNVSSGRKRGKQTISTSTFTMGKSDIDINIPTTEVSRDNTFAVIIANENYDNEKMVQFAYNDGQVFRDYCRKTLGLPEDNVHFRPDATLNNIKFEINWLKTVAKAHPNAQIIFYYAGHGMPDESTRESYLLPIDGYSTVASTGFKMSELYASLGSLPAKNVLVLLDACFSGADRNDDVLTSVRGVKIAPRIDKPRGNMIVFSATSNKQTALPYTEQSHGLFTYFILKWLQTNPTKTSFGAWFDYVKKNVAQKASVKNSKEQTPTTMISTSLAESWRNLSLL